jgi:hypothetical protein
MANRENPYEAAFEEFLRSRRIPYVAVDESKRSLLGDGSLKSLDFIVSPADGASWLVDVKGRRFPTASGEGKQYWKNWSTRDDLRSLAAWQRLFGDGFQGMLVFAYDVLGDRAPLPPEQLFAYRGALYGFLAVRLEDYAFHARPISLAWDTVAMPTERFRQTAVPIEALLAGSPAPAGLAG